MANSFKILLICNFMVFILSNSPLLQARESKFFSKFTHFTTLTNSQSENSPISEPPALAPLLSPAPAPSKGDVTEVSFDTTANGEETQLFDEGETYRKGSPSSSSSYNNNNNKYGYRLGSDSHETANRNGNYNYNYNTNNGYQLVSTSSSHENGYKPVSTSSSRETVANKGYAPNFSYNTNSIGDENELFSDEENEKKNQRVGYEPVSTSSSHETVANNGYTPNFSYNTNSFGDENELFRDEENEKRNQRVGYEPVSTSSSRDSAVNGEKNYNGYTPNFSYNTNSNGDRNEIFSDEGNEKKNQRQGMSDTRFMENGKYYYPVNGHNYEDNNQVNYNGNSRNEFNTMDFENQEVYEDSQEP